MKLIKVVGFLFQFGLIGLAFLTTGGERTASQVVAGPAAFSYADAVSLSAPSVVTIYTMKTVADKPHPLLDDPLFGQFFGDQLQRRQRSHSETNLGSGVIIGSEGYILTNQHVVDHRACWNPSRRYADDSRG